MSLPQKYLKVVAELAASGTLGAALLLGAAPPAMADQEPSRQQPTSAQTGSVAERLAAIREAVSAVDRQGAPADELQLAWGNWHNGWGGGGWGWGRPWGNFGFGVPWNNWNNWRNGWNNWRNWWNNF